MEKYAGIDIAKKVHWMCVTDGEGRLIMEPRPYDNDAEGLLRMVADLDLYGGDIAVGMESTGCYWRSCYKVLAEGGYPVSVINPVKTCAERKQGNLGRAKTDRVDCLVVADTLRKQGIAPTPSPDADAAQLRQPLRLVRAAIVAVAGHPQQRDPGIQPPQPVRVPGAVPQMEDGLGLYQLHALLHRVHAPVGIG